MAQPDAILIAGPTASGKSKLALELAGRLGGEIINADSMQVYALLRVLTARPDDEDITAIPHHLYGHTAPDRPYSTAVWASEAADIADDIWARGSVPVFVGGTGLYFRMLEEGLAEIPPIPDEIRRSVRSLLSEEGSDALHARLQMHDAVGAQRLRPGDGQRIARALEVVLASGKPLHHFHGKPTTPPLLGGKSVKRHLLMPERPHLHKRIEMRTRQMVDNGAVEEVRALLQRNLDPTLPVMKAIGVRELADFIQGEKSLNESIESINTATRRYAKRQYTWFRGQFSEKWKGK